jgi:hypothetical protein
MWRTSSSVSPNNSLIKAQFGLHAFLEHLHNPIVEFLQAGSRTDVLLLFGFLMLAAKTAMKVSSTSARLARINSSGLGLVKSAWSSPAACRNLNWVCWSIQGC